MEDFRKMVVEEAEANVVDVDSIVFEAHDEEKEVEVSTESERSRGDEEVEDGQGEGEEDDEKLMREFHQSLDCEACDIIAKAALSVKSAPQHVVKRE